MNLRYQTRRFCQLAFTFGLAMASTSLAHADRVVVVSPGGEAEQELLDDVEEALGNAVRTLGHEAATEAGALETAGAPAPSTANELKAIAEMQNATYVLVPSVQAVPHGYAMHLRVGYAPTTRMEELDVEVGSADEAERLADILRAALRPEGVGEDAVRLAEYRATARAATTPSPAPAPEEQRAPAHEERPRARAPQTERETAMSRGLWMVGVGIDVRPVLSHHPDREGGVLYGISLRGGRAVRRVPGLEVRTTLDIVNGASGGFALSVGSTYLANLFKRPIFVGGEANLGFYKGITGNHDVVFMGRLSPVIAWRPTGRLYLEAALPELMYLGEEGGALSLGMSLRAGVRF